MTDSQKPIRSPSYPSMSLRDAVNAVRKIEAEYRKFPADRENAVKLIGYSSLSGPAAKALAALAHYGLVERAGKGELRVSDRAVKILHAENDGERAEELTKAAFDPDIFRDFQDRWPDMSPPEDGIATYLRRQGFNENAIRPTVLAYLDTLAFMEEAKVTERHGQKPPTRQESGPSDNHGPDHGKFGGARVGDLIQWESQGALQFNHPLRVRLVSDDGDWVAVEGSETGIPMSEVIVEEKSQGTPPMFSLLPTQEGPRAAKGEVEWIRNRLSQDTDVRLLVKGEMGPKEIGKLIKLLEAQKLVLEDD